MKRQIVERWKNVAQRLRSPALTMLAATAFAMSSAPALGQEAPAEAPAKTLNLSLTYNADLMGVVSGGERRGADYVDRLVVSADLDLDRAVGWRGANVRLDVEANSGGRPGALAASLVGVDANELNRRGARLGQAYVQQSFAGSHASLLFGFYDLGTDFNVAPSTGLLIGAGPGLSPEFAASGANGPSVFPETALTLRLRVQPSETTYAQVMAANAHAGALGDPGGPDFAFHEGLLMAVEAGYVGGGAKLAVGGWRYTRAQPDLRDVTLGGDPVGRTAQGAYVIGELPLHAPADGVGKTTAFAKFGFSDGHTTAYSGSWNAGVLVEHLWASRPDSSASFGVSQGRFTHRFRANAADVGDLVGPAETDFEITYADRLAPHLKLQPDLQWIHRPSGQAAIADALVLGLRLTVEL
jgi:porin